MPELKGDRFWFGPEDGRGSNDFGADPRPSRDIGVPLDGRPRDNAQPLPMATGGIPRAADYRRGTFAVSIPVRGFGPFASGYAYVFGASLTVLSGGTPVPANAVYCVTAGGQVVMILGASGGNVFNAVPVNVASPELHLLNTATGLIMADDPSILTTGVVYAAPMD